MWKFAGISVVTDELAREILWKALSCNAVCVHSLRNRNAIEVSHYSRLEISLKYLINIFSFKMDRYARLSTTIQQITNLYNRRAS